MQDNRQLYILGAGGLFAILFLLPSWDFTIKIILSTLILGIAMALALVKYGQDRIPLEQYLYRQIRYRLGVLRYSYHGGGRRPVLRPLDHSAPSPSIFPVSVDWDEANVYFLLTVWMAVIGAYFTTWLYMGGSVELANWLTGKY